MNKLINSPKSLFAIDKELCYLDTNFLSDTVDVYGFLPSQVTGKREKHTVPPIGI